METQHGGTEVRRLAFNLDESARALGVARNTMRELIDSGRVRAVRVGRRRLVSSSELERFLAEDRGDECPAGSGARDGVQR